ncbi:MAG: hypothetical protein P1P88_25105, partial [Bacteroidales bacterium]|nr:hypothetical protein [Bacteroidales bacterium]
PELIESGKNGQLYELGNAVDLANKISFFIENPDQLEKCGSYAQKYAIDNFSSKKNSDAIHQIIDDLIQKQRIKS